MEKLTRRFKRNRSKEMSSSLDFLSFGGLCDEHMQHREENCLRRLTFSSVSVGVLPVFLARARTACETESLVRASSSISVLTPTELNHGSFMESAVTFPQSFQLPTMPGSAVPKCPFRATALWENTILHLENSIKPGRHTRGLRIYDNCFRGAEAVACLSTYLNAVMAKTVSRGQVLILCQKLVMTGIMEDVKDKGRTTFKEGRLYRFSKEHFWQQPAGEFSPTPTLLGYMYQDPTPQSTQTERHKIERKPAAPLAVTSIKYPSDSTINAVSSRTKHIFHRQSSYESHSQRNIKTAQTLKKTKSLMLHWHSKKIRPDPPPPPHSSDHGGAKLSRRNAMRRESRPIIMKLPKVRDQEAFTEAEDQQEVYRAMAPAQRSQSQSYKIKNATDIPNYRLQRKFTERIYLQTEKEDVSQINDNKSKLRKGATMKEKGHRIKCYCIDTTLHQGHANKSKLFNVCVSPVSSVREDAQTAAPAPAGMNWVVYGYL